MTDRKHKTPRQRAEEALGVAQRRVARLEAELYRLRLKHAPLEKELKAARARLEHAKANPDLPPDEGTKPPTA